MSLKKSVDFYTFLGDERFYAETEQPKDTGHSEKSKNYKDTYKMIHKKLDISSADIGWFDLVGKYTWRLYETVDGKGFKLMSRNAQVNPYTGNISDSKMDDMMDTHSKVTDDYAITYGFYDAGALTKLTNHHQSYVYITNNHSNWMGDLVADSDYSHLSESPFSIFALPGAHDAGTFDLKKVSDMLDNSKLLDLLAKEIGVTYTKIIAKFTQLEETVVRRSIINLAVTQKDNIGKMLDLGIRYFDFRPGFMYKHLDKDDKHLYHQHNFIPGYRYDKFLKDILNWLEEHPTEIVVVSVGFSGFYSKTMRPDVDTLNDFLEKAIQDTGTSIQTTDKDSLGQTYNDLIKDNKRLVFLNNGIGVDDAKKYDSYDEDVYQTTDVENIIGALEGMKSDKDGTDYTVLQLQGTANGTVSGILSGVATMSDASSPILSTKAAFDHKTYKWLEKEVPSRFSKDKLLVFLNDFAANDLAHQAIVATKGRLGKGN